LEGTMSSQAATSSDLDLARVLSQRLVGRAAPAPAPATVPVVQYVTFAAATRPEAAPAVAPPLDELTTFESWDDLLQWAMPLAGAVSAFVMDPEGFAIATKGDLVGESAQAVGAQLMVTMAEADRVEYPATPALAMSVEYASTTLTGVRVERDPGQAFTIGFLAHLALSPANVAAVRFQVTHNLGHL